MGKYYVAVTTNSTKYKLCKEDIQRVYSLKIRKIPRLPAFNHSQKMMDTDVTTDYDDSEVQFEPIQFFTNFSMGLSEEWRQGWPESVLFKRNIQQQVCPVIQLKLNFKIIFEEYLTFLGRNTIKGRKIIKNREKNHESRGRVGFIFKKLQESLEGLVLGWVSLFKAS